MSDYEEDFENERIILRNMAASRDFYLRKAYEIQRLIRKNDILGTYGSQLHYSSSPRNDAIYVLVEVLERHLESEHREEKKKNPGPSKKIRKQVFERDRYRCVKCGAWEDLTVDHIVPRSKGGSNDLDNLQTMCRICNSEKGTKSERVKSP